MRVLRRRREKGQAFVEYVILVAVIGVLFVVYFWNLDQKLLGWAYKQVNLIFDRKKVNQVF